MGMRFLRSLIRNARGASAVEFAMVAPVLLGMILGAIEIGRFAVISGTLSSAVRETARIAMVSSATSPDPQDETSLRQLVFDRMVIGDPANMTVVVSYSPANEVGGVVRIDATYEYVTFTPGVPEQNRAIPIQRVMEMAILD
jgi:Flp pilus assembly pilin Flp